MERHLSTIKLKKEKRTIEDKVISDWAAEKRACMKCFKTKNDLMEFIIYIEFSAYHFY